ncbi:MAG: ankyrin repeat domain-containing protein, partial [Verrucomicrobiaceae bacterium]
MAGLFGLSKTKTKTPMNLLYGAIYQSDVPAAKSALDNGADPNGGSAEKGDYGYKHNTPLAVACATKNPEIIRLLIKRGAEVNARSGALAGVTPLEVAVAPSVEEQAGTANPATVEAAVRGRLAAVKLLLDNGADPKIKSRLGSNALTAAAGCGPVEIVEL